MKSRLIFGLPLLFLVCFHTPLKATELTEDKISNEPKDKKEMALSVNISGKLKLCSIEDKGFVYLDIKGGNPPYSISWQNENSEPFLYDLNPGSYTVSIKDNSGNQLTERFMIQPAIPIKVGINEINHADTESGNLGSATLNLKTFGNQKVKIEWCNGLQDSLVAKDLTPGTYTVKVIDEGGCDSTISFEIQNKNSVTGTSVNENKSEISSKLVAKKSTEEDKSQNFNRTYSKEELMKIAGEIQIQRALAQNK